MFCAHFCGSPVLIKAMVAQEQESSVMEVIAEESI